MDILSKIFSPSGPLAKLLFVIFLLLVTGAAAVVVMSVFVLFQTISPQRLGADLTPDQVFNKPTVVDFSTPSGSRDGWFFPGLKGAPTILVCHGYGSSRGDILTLASALQEHQYNVFVFDFAGHGKSSGRSALGSAEVKELIAAVDAVAERDDVDRQRFGAWGVDLGGYAALAAAAADKRIQAVAVDTVYDTPAQMLSIQLQHSGFAGVPLLARLAGWEFTLLHFGARNVPPLTEQVRGLSGIPKLFIQTRGNPQMTEVTRELFLRSPEPREQSVLPRSAYAAMMEEEKKEYENSVVTYFLTQLPVSTRSSVPPIRPAR